MLITQIFWKKEKNRQKSLLIGFILIIELEEVGHTKKYMTKRCKNTKIILNRKNKDRNFFKLI
nr:MAG TPA: hypothetical protein [Crassvirales sp.]